MGAGVQADGTAREMVSGPGVPRFPVGLRPLASRYPKNAIGLDTASIVISEWIRALLGFNIPVFLFSWCVGKPFF